MRVRDSRRVPGPNLLWERPGVVLDVELSDDEAAVVIERWSQEARRMLDALGWGDEELRVRRFPGGASLALSAPIDALYSATEIDEWALQAAQSPPGELDEPLARLQASIAKEQRQKKGLASLADAAVRHGVTLLFDDDCTSVGLGTGSLSFATQALPAVQSVDWERVHDIPLAVVTGTNGKSTSVRLLEAIANAAGKVAGSSSTDFVRVAGEVLERGDYSGPSGARRVLRDQRVELAILETARGGILRRGLPVRRADAALITNIAEDHLGEWGVHDLATLTDVKFVVAKVVRPGGRLVLNADDPAVATRGSAERERAQIVWFTLDPSNARVRAHLAEGGEACFAQDDALWFASGSERVRVAGFADVPSLFGGAARHNVANALGAIGVAHALSLSFDAIAAGLSQFGSTPAENPGRLNEFHLGGVRALADFAHNPHGLEALIEMIRALPAKRRLMILGQAGDRDDGSIRELARIAARANPERIVVKEMRQHLRGRRAGEIPAMIEDELARAGVPAERIVRADSELDAVRAALRWAEPGDLLLLLLHAQRAEALELLEGLCSRGWRPGEPLEP